jgi:hypothetical protein
MGPLVSSWLVGSSSIRTFGGSLSIFIVISLAFSRQHSAFLLHVIAWTSRS